MTWGRRRSSKTSVKRSGFEDKVSQAFDALGVDYVYEEAPIKYVIPARNSSYTPDFALKSTGILLETKGWLDPDDRRKLALVKEQHPKLDLRVFFQRRADALRPIAKGSTLTTADWLDASGIPWAAEALPMDWVFDDASLADPSFLDNPGRNLEGVDAEVTDGTIHITSSRRTRSNAAALSRASKGDEA